MDKDLLYAIQRLCLNINAGSTALKKNIPYAPKERQFLLPDERQTYDSELAIPLAGDEKLLHKRIKKLCLTMIDHARDLLKSQHTPPHSFDLEAIYAENEGEDYCAPVIQSDGMVQLNGSLNLLDDLNSLHDTLIMYQDCFPPEYVDRWCHQLSMILERADTQIRTPSRNL